jgi:hypothetical protein
MVCADLAQSRIIKFACCWLLAQGAGGCSLDKEGEARPSKGGADSSQAHDTGDAVGDDTGGSPTDLDDDGWSVQDGDCDDGDSTVFPGAEEVACDGVDNDCSDLGEAEKFVLVRTQEFYTVFQDALDSTIDGDVLLVCPGRHVVSGYVSGRTGLVLRSWSGSAEDTWLERDPLASRALLEIEDVSGLVVEDLTFTSPGSIAQEGGCLRGRESLATVRRSHFKSCNGTAGGIFISWLGDVPPGSPLLVEVEDSDFAECGSPDSGQLSVWVRDDEDVDEEAPQVVVRRTIFRDAENPDGTGGIDLAGPLDALIENSDFTGNIANDGGVHWYGYRAVSGLGRLQIVRSTFTGNAGTRSGALHMTSVHSPLISTVLEVSGCTFEDNFGGDGGAMSLTPYSAASSSMNVLIEDSTFRGNDSERHSPSAVAIHTDNMDPLATGTVTLRDVLFQENNDDFSPESTPAYPALGIESQPALGVIETLMEDVQFVGNVNGAFLVSPGAGSTLVARNVTVTDSVLADPGDRVVTAGVRARSASLVNLSFLRNGLPAALFVGPPVGTEGNSFTHAMENIEFGVGLDANTGEDIYNCEPDRLGTIDSAILTEALPCP